MDRLLACTCSLLASPSSLPHLLPRKIVSKRDRVINLRNSRYHFSSIGERKLRYDETRVIKLLTMLSFTLVETRLVTIVLISNHHLHLTFIQFLRQSTITIYIQIPERLLKKCKILSYHWLRYEISLSFILR